MCVCCFKLLFFLFSIEVQLIYNVVSLTSVKQRDSVIYLVFIFFSIMVPHRILDTVLCAIQ